MREKYFPTHLNEDRYEGLDFGWSFDNFQDIRGPQMQLLIH